jgi:hypothetical protein
MSTLGTAALDARDCIGYGRLIRLVARSAAIP